MASSQTIDVGIDLGTSNSAVAVAVDGDVQVVLNNDNQLVTPSAVQFQSGGSVRIGQKAYQDRALQDDQNSFTQFKRRMGLQEGEYVPAARRKYTPEELAGELLKSLRGDAEGFLGHQIESAVITVPAMFELVQAEATQRAAELAGIKHAPLLQEPIAAGLAYGYDRDIDDGFYLVYDLGGGTFDATIVRVRDGQFSVQGSDGDNYLGGSDMDQKLATYIGQELMDRGYSLWSDDDVAGHEFRIKLRYIAEDAKKRLTRLQQVNVGFDMFAGPLTDARGMPIEIAISISRDDYEPLITGMVERSAEIVKRLLEHERLAPGDVSRMLLIGGPTYTPLVRRMLPVLTGILVETKIDPMTSVAQGAAWFAAGMPLPVPKQHLSVDVNAARLSLSFPTSTSDTITHVGGRLEGVSANDYSIEIRRNDGGWTSGRIPMQGNAFMTTVHLEPKRSNGFLIACLDAQGRKVPVEPDTFSIAQGIMVSEPPLARSIVVAARNDHSVVGRRLLNRGVSLPATGRETFRTDTAVNPGEVVDALNIHVFEGEYESFHLNRHVGFMQIRGDQISRYVPMNTPVEVTIKVDASRKATVRAYIPLLDQTFEQVLTGQVLQPGDPAQVRERIEKERNRAESLAKISPRDRERIDRAATEIESDLKLADGGDQTLALRASRRADELSDEINRLMETYQVELLLNEVALFLEYTDYVADQCSGEPNHMQYLAQLHQRARNMSSSSDPAELVALREQIRALYFEIVENCASWWVGRFLFLSDRAQELRLARTLEPLLMRGQAAIHADNFGDLRLVCRRLDEALPWDSSRDQLVSPGLRV